MAYENTNTRKTVTIWFSSKSFIRINDQEFARRIRHDIIKNTNPLDLKIL